MTGERDAEWLAEALRAAVAEARDAEKTRQAAFNDEIRAAGRAGSWEGALAGVMADPRLAREAERRRQVEQDRPRDELGRFAAPNERERVAGDGINAAIRRAAGFGTGEDA